MISSDHHQYDLQKQKKLDKSITGPEIPTTFISNDNLITDFTNESTYFSLDEYYKEQDSFYNFQYDSFPIDDIQFLLDQYTNKPKINIKEKIQSNKYSEINLSLSNHFSPILNCNNKSSKINNEKKVNEINSNNVEPFIKSEKNNLEHYYDHMINAKEKLDNEKMTDKNNPKPLKNRIVTNDSLEKKLSSHANDYSLSKIMNNEKNTKIKGNKIVVKLFDFNNNNSKSNQHIKQRIKTEYQIDSALNQNQFSTNSKIQSPISSPSTQFETDKNDYSNFESYDESKVMNNSQYVLNMPNINNEYSVDDADNNNNSCNLPKYSSEAEQCNLFDYQNDCNTKYFDLQQEFNPNELLFQLNINTDSFQNQIYFQNFIQQQIEEQIRSQLLYEPPLFSALMSKDELTLNPYLLKFEPISYWKENRDDITFRNVVNNFFRKKTRIAKFIYKLYDMLILTLKIPLFKGIIGVNWITDKIFSVNVEYFAALLNIEVSSVDSLLSGNYPNFTSLGFTKVTENNYYKASLSSFPEISESNIILMYHSDLKFINKEMTTYELDEIENHYIMKKYNFTNNKILNYKYPCYT